MWRDRITYSGSAFFIATERFLKMTEIISIKKLVVGLLLGIVICLANGAIPVSAADMVVVNATDVNVRSEPNTKSKSYGKANKGDVFARAEARADGWSQIAYFGVMGYIKTEFLVPSNMGDAASQDALAQQFLSLSNGTMTAASTTAAVSKAATTTQSAATQSTTVSQQSSGGMVWIPNSGSKYHSRSGCSNMKNPRQVTLDKAISLGYTPCKKCN